MFATRLTALGAFTASFARTATAFSTELACAAAFAALAVTVITLTASIATVALRPRPLAVTTVCTLLVATSVCLSRTLRAVAAIAFCVAGAAFRPRTHSIDSVSFRDMSVTIRHALTVCWTRIAVTIRAALIVASATAHVLRRPARPLRAFWATRRATISATLRFRLRL